MDIKLDTAGVRVMTSTKAVHLNEDGRVDAENTKDGKRAVMKTEMSFLRHFWSYSLYF